MNHTTIFRLVQPEDNVAIAQVIRTVFDEHNAPTIGTVYSDPTTDNLYELFQKQGSILWIAEIDSHPIGCCGVYPTPGLDLNCAELVKFYLARPTRGMGVGKALLEKCIHSAKEMGYKQLYLESIPEFVRAVSIYETLGFKHLPRPLGNSGHSGCTIWMQKEL